MPTLKRAPQADADLLAEVIAEHHPEFAEHGTQAGERAGNDAPRQFSLRSSMNLGPQAEFDASLRSVASLPNPVVPGYVALDLRWAWQFSKAVELSVTGLNLLDGGHTESGSAASRTYFARSFLLKSVWKF